MDHEVNEVEQTETPVAETTRSRSQGWLVFTTLMLLVAAFATSSALAGSFNPTVIGQYYLNAATGAEEAKPEGKCCAKEKAAKAEGAACTKDKAAKAEGGECPASKAAKAEGAACTKDKEAKAEGTCPASKEAAKAEESAKAEEVKVSKAE